MAEPGAVFFAHRRRCARVTAVRKLLPMIALLMLAMLAWAVPTQAGGVSACATGVEAACFSHTPGDVDEAPADEHDTQPHHHGGCHGHHIGLADHDRADGPQAGLGQTEFAQALVRPVSSGTDPGLRPPQA
jgi:hypothetical protein